MSRPAPTQKQNFIQTALIMLVVYFGFNLYLNSTKQKDSKPTGPVLVSRADYMRELQEDDRKGLEVQAQKLLGDFNTEVDKDLKAKTLSPQEAEFQKIQAGALVANGFLRGGLVSDDSNKIRIAYQILQPFFRHDQSNPAWTTPIDIWERNPLSTGTRKNPSPEKPFVAAKVTPQVLDNQIIDTLSLRNKSDLVWGFIPGGYQLVDFLVHLTGAQPYFSYWFAALLLAIAVRGAVFPLAQKQLMFSRQMSQLAPRITEIKNQFSDDKTEQSKRTMDLYKEYGINPAAGCLPAFVQMPLFLTVYQCMLHYQFQFSKGYFLWINNGASEASHGFIAANLGQQDYILIGIYGVSMTVSSLLTPITDPTQYKQQRLMGVGMSIMVTIFMFIGVVPVVSGFVLYWTFTNLLATAQSFRAYRMPLPPLVKVNAPGGGVYPQKGVMGIWTKMMEDAQKMSQENGKADKPTLLPNNPTPSGKAEKNGSSDKIQNGEVSTSNSNGKVSNSDSKIPTNDGVAKEPKYKPKKRG
jgi:YidC/Oxa1 family membrane protein insertase